MSTAKKSGGHSYCCTECSCFKTNKTGTKRLASKSQTAPAASSCNGTACGEYAIDTVSSNGDMFTIKEVSTDINPSCNPKISSDQEKQLKEELSNRLKNAVYARISQLVDTESGYWLEKGMIFKGCFDFEAIVCKDDMNITETPLHTFGRA